MIIIIIVFIVVVSVSLPPEIFLKFRVWSSVRNYSHALDTIPIGLHQFFVSGIQPSLRPLRLSTKCMVGKQMWLLFYKPLDFPRMPTIRISWSKCAAHVIFVSRLRTLDNNFLSLSLLFSFRVSEMSSKLCSSWNIIIIMVTSMFYCS